MINFFRKTRKKLADDNKPMKYARYAVGEILLVVIGILIALQINNWNGNRKNNANEIIFLKGLILNLETDITALNSVISRSNGKMLSITYISNLFYKQDEANIESPLKDHIVNMWGVVNYSNQSFVFDGIKSSGKLNLIKSRELLFDILSYYHANNEVLSMQQLNNTNINNLMFEPFFRNKIDINSVIEPLFPESVRSEYGDLDYSFFNQDSKSSEVKEFRNSLSGIKGFIGVNNSSLKMLLTKAKNLKSELQVYLNANGNKKNPIGQSHILVNGKSNFHEIEIQDGANFDNWLEIDSNKININYPKDLGYGVIRFVDSKIKNNLASSVNYSGYKSISLELKGEVGGELVSVAFLDTDDAADGGETHVPLVLTDQWDTYEIDLEKFQATNFNSLIESPVIVLHKEALSFGIKNIEFKK